MPGIVLGSFNGVSPAVVPGARGTDIGKHDAALVGVWAVAARGLAQTRIEASAMVGFMILL